MTSMSLNAYLTDYALVHLKFTIPPTLLLTFFARPLLTRLDWYKTTFLIFIAVTASTPWDSYLIRHGIWTYPANSVLPGRVYGVPLEEFFFFIIQTYLTSVIYLLLSKITFFPALLTAKYLPTPHEKQVVNPAYTWRNRVRSLGVVACIIAFSWSSVQLQSTGKSTYLALILVWASPVVLLLWFLCCNLLLALPWYNTILPVFLPTFYLWVVDTLSLQKGTWSISSATKYGVCLWPNLEIEEALFFLVTNVMVVFGLVAFDNALTVGHAFPNLFPDVPAYPSPLHLMKALLLPASKYDANRLESLFDAKKRLKNKSRSFWLASSAFDARLRIDLVLLYSFCRSVDDLIDTAESLQVARSYVNLLHRFLDIAYDKKSRATRSKRLLDIILELPKEYRSAFKNLPTEHLPQRPLKLLLAGMETDLAFSDPPYDRPIRTETDLDAYAYQVAGTIGELCINLIYVHSGITPPVESNDIVRLGCVMGQALQLINIARDIYTDACMDRIYIPEEWSVEVDVISPKAILEHPDSTEVVRLRQQLLDKAMRLYTTARPAVELLPKSGRAPIRVAIESYVEIGRTLIKKNRQQMQKSTSKATVPLLRRITVAWRALSQG